MTRPAANRIKVTSTTNGIGPFTVGGAVGGEHVHAFLASLNGKVVDYSIDHDDAAEWEDGRGVYTHSGTTTLSRLYIENGSNGSSLVSFSSGNKTVRLALLASSAIETVETTDPTSAHGLSQGYVAGRSRWLNSTSGVLWFCTADNDSASPQAADWTRVGAEGITSGDVADLGNMATEDFATSDEALIGTATDKGMTPALVRTQTGTFVYLDGRASAGNITNILNSHAGLMIDINQNLTLDNSLRPLFGNRQANRDASQCRFIEPHDHRRSRSRWHRYD